MMTKSRNELMLWTSRAKCYGLFFTAILVGPRATRDAGLTRFGTIIARDSCRSGTAGRKIQLERF